MTQAWLCGWEFAPTRNDSFVSTLACASACICHCAAQYLLLVLAASCLLVTFAHCTFANNPLFSQQALGGYEDDTWTIPVLQVKPVLYLGALVCHSVPALLGPMQWMIVMEGTTWWKWRWRWQKRCWRWGREKIAQRRKQSWGKEHCLRSLAHFSPDSHR